MTLNVPPPARGSSGLARLDLADLLLILILSLGGVRLLGLLIGAGASDTAALPDQEDESIAGLVIALFSLQCAIFVSSLYLVAVRGRGVSWSELGLRRPNAPWRFRAVVATMAAFPLVGLVNGIVAGLIGRVPENPQLEIIAPTVVSGAGAFGMLLTLAVVVPIAEELLFRGLLYAWLRERIGLRPAMLISALAFSLLHGIAWLIPAFAMLGLILAWVYERSDSLWAPIVTHGLFNATSTGLVFLAARSGLLPG